MQWHGWGGELMSRMFQNELNQGVGEQGVRAWYMLCLFGVTLAIVLIPLLVVIHPPLHDYPFHIARIDILARWHSVDALQRWYELQAFMLPNVGMDLLTLLIHNAFSIESSGRIVVGLIISIILSGCVFLHRTLHGHYSLFPLISAFFVFNWILLFGFVNYLLGVGVLLWATGIWILLTGTNIWARLIVGTLLSCVLFLCHIVALGLFGLVIAGYELTRAMRAFRTRRWHTIPDLVIGAAIFVVPFAMYIWSSTSNAGSNVYYGNLFWIKKITNFRMLLFGDWYLDVSLVAATAIVLVIFWRVGRFRYDPRMILATGLVSLSYLVLPVAMLGGWYLDTRLVLPLCLIVIASANVDLGACRRLRLGLISCLALFLLLRFLYITLQWKDYDQTIQEFTSAFGSLPPNSIVMAISAVPEPRVSDLDLRLWQPPLKHVTSLASLGTPVFVPSTYAEATQQPLTVTKGYLDFYAFQEDRDPVIVENMKEYADALDRLHVIAAGNNRLDEPIYVLLLYPEHLDALPAEFPSLVASGEHFYLFELENGL
jgi:hypothetical protein